MTKYHELDIRDVRNPMWVFYSPPEAPNGELLAPEYAGMDCERCHKLDYEKALDRGIRMRPSGPQVLPDASFSGDRVAILSFRSRDVLEAVAPGTVKFVPFADRPDFFAAFPVRLFSPSPNARRYGPLEDAREGDAFQVRGAKCQKCKRFREVTYKPELFLVPEGVDLAGLVIDNSEVPSIAWVASDEVADAIKEARLTGWWIHRNAFANARK